MYELQLSDPAVVSSSSLLSVFQFNRFEYGQACGNWHENGQCDKEHNHFKENSISSNRFHMMQSLQYVFYEITSEPFRY